MTRGWKIIAAAALVLAAGSFLWAALLYTDARNQREKLAQENARLRAAVNRIQRLENPTRGEIRRLIARQLRGFSRTQVRHLVSLLLRGATPAQLRRFSVGGPAPASPNPTGGSAPRPGSAPAPSAPPSSPRPPPRPTPSPSRPPPVTVPKPESPLIQQLVMRACTVLPPLRPVLCG